MFKHLPTPSDETSAKIVEFLCKRYASGTLEDINKGLADVNCWLAGFVAGGSQYTPGTQDALRAAKLLICDLFEFLEADKR